MAVVYMLKLEEEPSTYEKEFTALTKGVNKQVQEWILQQVKSDQLVLDVGCGPGVLALKMAEKGAQVVGIDQNPQMIETSLYSSAPKSEGLKLSVNFLQGTFRDMPPAGQLGDSEEGDGQYDIITSTFMLSELRPLEQQIFLRTAWNRLKDGGKLLLAAEFEPSGFALAGFRFKRWFYRRKLKKEEKGGVHPLHNFEKYLAPIGFEIVSVRAWQHGAIKALELRKVQHSDANSPGYYQPTPLPTRGIGSWLRKLRCLYTGQIDLVPIEPGIYRSGNPSSKSPLLVTCNYDYTYITFMRDIEGLDAWVLVVDSRGINVWCAARGDDFGNRQVLEVIEATNIRDLTTQKTLFLPQLSAGGVAAPKLPMNTKEFPFTIMYGPVWSSDLPTYLETKPVRKPASMRMANFTPFHRVRAWVTHSSFLLRRVYSPTIIGAFLLLILLGFFGQPNRYWIVIDFIAFTIVANFIIAMAFPLTNYTRDFLKKAEFFGILTIIAVSILLWFEHGVLGFIFWNMPLMFWLGYFSTMSFSGYTMATSPREIKAIYPKFNKIQQILVWIGLVCSTIGVILL